MLLEKTNDLNFVCEIVKKYTKAYLDVVEEMKEDPNARLVFTAEFFINVIKRQAKEIKD
jgi:hypothetical protein